MLILDLFRESCVAVSRPLIYTRDTNDTVTRRTGVGPPFGGFLTLLGLTQGSDTPTKCLIYSHLGCAEKGLVSQCVKKGDTGPKSCVCNKLRARGVLACVKSVTQDLVLGLLSLRLRLWNLRVLCGEAFWMRFRLEILENEGFIKILRARTPHAPGGTLWCRGVPYGTRWDTVVSIPVTGALSIGYEPIQLLRY